MPYMHIHFVLFTHGTAPLLNHILTGLSLRLGFVSCGGAARKPGFPATSLEKKGCSALDKREYLMII